MHIVQQPSEYDAMLPPQFAEITSKVVAVGTLCFSAIFGNASPAQALGVLVPIGFLIYKWHNEGLRRRVLQMILSEQDKSRRDAMIGMLKKSETTPGGL